jgi:hypothetical protein
MGDTVIICDPVELSEGELEWLKNIIKEYGYRGEIIRKLMEHAGITL